MSFMLTKRQMRDKSKSVTRRLGWMNLKAGDLIQACEKCMGLKPGEKIVKICIIRVVNVRREKLSAMLENRDYGFLECVLEGFPKETPQSFVEMFCHHMKCDYLDKVNRIQFEYL